MKKAKLLTPVLAVATLASVAPVITLATSCNKSAGDQIELDSSTSKEQTTSVNKTMTTYVFNVKNSLKTVNEDDEIEADVEDVQTTDGVSVEISSIKYDASTGKCYVTITTSKEDGTLNDQESVDFSLNFHCHAHGSKADKWTKKFTKFIIKHSKSLLDDVHFDDTDTTKRIKKDAKGDFEETITLPATDVWAAEPAEGEYDIDNLKCYILRDVDHHHWIDSISLDDSEAIKPTYDSTTKTISLTVKGNVGEFAHYGQKARFALLFTYPDETIFQTIGGFSVQYVENIEDPHLQLISSREQHYYLTKSTDTETAVNSVGFVLDDAATYAADDFEIASSSSNIKVTNKFVFTDEATSKQILLVNYSVEQEETDPRSFIANVSFSIKYTKDTTTWTEQVNGLSFFMVGKDWITDSLISYDKTSLDAVAWKSGSATDFNDVLRTCFPFVNINDFTYVYSYVTIDGTAYDCKISQLGYLLETELYSQAKIATTDVDAGNHDVQLFVYIISFNAAYYYSLNIGTVEFKA